MNELCRPERWILLPPSLSEVGRARRRAQPDSGTGRGTCVSLPQEMMPCSAEAHKARCTYRSDSLLLSLTLCEDCGGGGIVLAAFLLTVLLRCQRCLFSARVILRHLLLRLLLLLLRPGTGARVRWGDTCTRTCRRREALLPLVSVLVIVLVVACMWPVISEGEQHLEQPDCCSCCGPPVTQVSLFPSLWSFFGFLVRDLTYDVVSSLSLVSLVRPTRAKTLQLQKKRSDSKMILFSCVLLFLCFLPVGRSCCRRVVFE